MANLSTVRLLKNLIKMKIHLTISILMNNVSFATKQCMIKSTMEFDGQSVDSEKALKSDQNEGSLNLIKAWNEVEEPEEATVSHPVSMSECHSSKSIFNDSNEWPSQSANFLSVTLNNKAMV